MNEAKLQHYVGKTVKTIETDGNLVLFIEFTDGHNLFIESDMESDTDGDDYPVLGITINSYTDELDEI